MDILIDKYIMSLYQDLEDEVIADIARRVKKTGRYTETAELMAKSMHEQGFSPAKIQAEVMKTLRADKAYQMAVAENTKAYKQEIQNIIDETVKAAKEANDALVAEAGNMAWNNDLSMWQEHGENLTKPNNMSQLISAARLQTMGALKNLTKTMGFRNTTLGTTGVMNAYQRELDLALIKVATGTFSFDQAVNDCVHRLAQSGLRSIDYESGRTYQIDTAVRMAVRTGMSQLAGKVMEANLESSGQDLVITSQHMGSRPEHAPWQNKVFSYSGKSKKYPDFFEETRYGEVDGLKGVNCTHDFYPFWEGASVIPDDITEPDPVEIDGKEYDYYQATQKQRQMERNIRAIKREIEAQNGLGGPTTELKSMLKAKTNEYERFSRKAGLKVRDNRLRVEKGTSNLSKKKSVPSRRKTVGNATNKRTQEELLVVSATIRDELAVLTDRKCRWSGKIIVDNNLCNIRNVDGEKQWDCSILLKDTVDDGVVIHEMLHAYSMSHYDHESYIKYGAMEEGVVELLTRELCSKKGINTSEVYEDYVVVLKSINDSMKFCKNDYEFAVKLFNIEPKDRYMWLHDSVSKYLSDNNVSIGDANDIMEFISILEDIEL